MVSSMGLVTAGKGEYSFQPSQLHMEKDIHPQTRERLESLQKHVLNLLFPLFDFIFEMRT